jgi:hypothetical protein
MPDSEIMKWLWSNAPNIAIAIGVAKIYYQVKSSYAKLEQQVSHNTEDIGLLIEIHTATHKDDLPKFYRRKNDNNG